MYASNESENVGDRKVFSNFRNFNSIFIQNLICINKKFEEFENFAQKVKKSIKTIFVFHIKLSCNLVFSTLKQS
jgi:hypothetical protein